MTTSWGGSHHRAIRALAVVCTVALAAALGLVRDSMTQSTAAMMLVLAVVAAAATSDRWAGALAAVTAALGFDYFLTAPYGSLAIRDSDDVELALALVSLGLIVTELALSGQRERAVPLDREGYLRGLSQLVDLPAGAWTAVPAGGSALGHFRVTTASRIVRPGRERPRVCYLAASTVGLGETTRG